MNYFWDQDAPYISFFDWHHNLYILLLGILLLFIITQYRYLQDNRETVRRWLLGIAVVQQIALYSWYIFEMGFDVSESLPLHISRISSILGIILLLSKNKKVLDVLFYFGLFAYGSFFYPSRVYQIDHIIGISFFVNHALTILIPIIAMVVTEWRPSFKALLKAYSWFLVYFFFIYFLNPLIDGNYFYLKYRPFFAYLPDYLYVPLVLVATFLIFLIGHYGMRTVWKFIRYDQNKHNEN